LLLTTFPMFSEAVTGRKVTMGPPIYNLVNIPWALALLALTGIGPLIAWRKASARNLKRNLLFPSLLGLWCMLAYIVRSPQEHLEALRKLGSALGKLDISAVLDSFVGFYPAITFGIGTFVIAGLGLEFYRGTRVRMHNHGEGAPVALGRMMWRNKRRWGGYIVHIGVVVIFFGIAGSSAYQQEAVQQLMPGQFLEVDDYLMRYDGFHLEAKDDHIGSMTTVSVFDRHSGKLLGQIEPAQLLHPNMMVSEQLRDSFLYAKSLDESGAPEAQQVIAGLYPMIDRLESQVRREVTTPSTEVAILSFHSPLDGTRFGEDFYAIPLYVDARTGEASFRVFINPLVNFIWYGGLIFIIGAHLCVLPDPRERRRLEQALDLEEAAVA
jgi:cytochrome c-type biogenesis protein CcmF